MKQYINLLKERPGFRYLWSATVVSLLGDWFNNIASIIIVSRYTDSGLAISWIIIARVLPRFFLGPVVGVVADRFDRKKIMIAADLLRSGIVLCFLLVDRPERVWLIYFLTTLQFIIASFYDPASSALTPSLLKSDKEILSANVLSSITWSAMLALGSALGGGFASAFGVYAALVADSITYLISAYFVIKIPSVVQEPTGSDSGWLDFVNGIKYVAKRPRVGMMTIVKALGQIGTGDIIMAVYAQRYFSLNGDDALALGVMFASAGVGAVLGPLFTRFFTNESRQSLQRWIQVGFLIVPTAWWFIGTGESLWVVSIGFMIRLMGVSINWTYSNALIQIAVPGNYLGRVFALDLALFTVVNSTSTYLTGYLIDSIATNPRTLSGYFGVANFIPVLIWAAFLIFSNIRYQET